MTPRHDSFTLTRDLAACRAHVWACWTDAGLKRQWFSAEDMSTDDYHLDLREGGKEYGRFTMAEGPARGVPENRTTFLVVRPDSLLVTAYTMAWDGRIHSASLATIRFEELGGGTRLTIREDGTWFEDSDGPEGRAHGTAILLDALERTLKETARGPSTPKPT